MTTRTETRRPNSGLRMQTNLRSARDPGDLMRDAVTLAGPAIGLTVPLSKLGIGANGRGTYVFTGTITDAGDGVAEQLCFSVDDGSNDNRFYVRNPSPNATLTLVRILGGAAGTASPGSVTDATQFRVAVAIDGDGGARASLDGGAVASVTGGPTSGLTTLRLGELPDGTGTMVGSISMVSIQPDLPVASAELQRLST